MKDTLKGIGIIIAFVLILTIGVPQVYHLIKYRNSEDIADEAMFEDMEETLGSQDSDIEGWFMLDKINAGLQPVEGCDSDGDGLTDKEEIEVYGSDPTKASTAGDLYTDGYKVENGMDLNTFYEYTEEEVFANNECSDVTLKAASASDFKGHVSTLSNISVDGYTVYKTYDVYSFSGDMTIDVSDIDEENLVVLVGHWYGGDMDKAKTTLDGNSLHVEYDFNSVNRYTVAVASSDSALNIFSQPSFEFNLNGEDDASATLEDAEFLYIHALFWRNLFMDSKPAMYYVSTGNDTTDSMIKAYLITMAYEVLDGYVDVDETDVKEISATKMKVLKNFFNTFEANKLTSINTNYCTPAHFVFMWSDDVLFNLSDYKAEITNIKDVNKSSHSSSTGFITYSDAFQFQNFRTEYVTGGNCAGISYYTAMLFNNGSAPSSGSYSSDKYDVGTTLTWDISGDEDNETLTDSGIYDYKDSSFVNDHKDSNKLMSNLSDGEEEFIKMISSYWAQVNDVTNSSNNIYYINDDYGAYSWDMIETMMDYLDNGKILLLGMMNSNGSGHMINVIDYTITADGSKVEFKLYDNNYPTNSRNGEKIDNVLTVTKKTCAEGYTESFTYYYKPYDDADFEYNSEYSKTGCKYFCVLDSDLSIIQ